MVHSLLPPLCPVQPHAVPPTTDACYPACRMMEKDPAQRATVPELLQHPWLNHHAGATHEPCDAARPSLRGHVPDAVVQRLQAFSALNRFNKVRQGAGMECACWCGVWGVWKASRRSRAAPATCRP
eukprot:357205-Chlamydomonas_euryale.AAC.3